MAASTDYIIAITTDKKKKKNQTRTVNMIYRTVETYEKGFP